jgi:uncharacterized DUF497 family protein
MGKNKYEWDDKKNKSNRRKHGIRFENAVDVFKDEKRITDKSPQTEHGEDRYITIGSCLSIRKIIRLIWTPRNDSKRVISAHKAKGKDLRKYQDGFGKR